MLSLNFKHGKENIEIRHREQPLRAFIVDNQVLRMKEVSEPTGKIHELNKRMFLYYTIKDKEWIEWLARVFWKMFSNGLHGLKSWYWKVKEKIIKEYSGIIDLKEII